MEDTCGTWHSHTPAWQRGWGPRRRVGRPGQPVQTEDCAAARALPRKAAALRVRMPPLLPPRHQGDQRPHRRALLPARWLWGGHSPRPRAVAASRCARACSERPCQPSWPGEPQQGRRCGPLCRWQYHYRRRRRATPLLYRTARRRPSRRRHRRRRARRRRHCRPPSVHSPTHQPAATPRGRPPAAVVGGPGATPAGCPRRAVVHPGIVSSPHEAVARAHTHRHMYTPRRRHTCICAKAHTLSTHRCKCTQPLTLAHGQPLLAAYVCKGRLVGDEVGGVRWPRRRHAQLQHWVRARAPPEVGVRRLCAGAPSG
jgi:hypothetical protein